MGKVFPAGTLWRVTFLAFVWIIIYIDPGGVLSVGTRFALVVAVSVVAGVTLGRIAIVVGPIVLMGVLIVAEISSRHSLAVTKLVAGGVILVVIQGIGSLAGERLKILARPQDS